MRYIDINKEKGFEVINFPDGQTSVRLHRHFYDDEDEAVSVVVSIDSPKTLLILLQLTDALKREHNFNRYLKIKYLMGARSDRVMVPGASFDLKIIADLINYCEYKSVELYDPHSDVASALINNCTIRNNKDIVKHYDIPDSVLICPDAGAAKKCSDYLSWNENIKEIVYCVKHRDLATGNLTIKVLEPERCKHKNVIIIDDICDGGGTFIGIREQIKPKHSTLMVTHSIFSKGIKILEKHFDLIICSDSYPNNQTSEKLKTLWTTT